MPFNSSKWALHKHYSRSSRLRRYLPPTAVFSRKTLSSYMARYSSVFIKPDREHMGTGVIKAWRKKGMYTYVVMKGREKSARSIKTLYSNINRQLRKQRYIIQKTIPLAKVHGRHFDIRVMMMRNAAGKWEYAGMLAKVAGRNSIITNVRQGGGYALKVGTALASTLSQQKNNAVQRKLIRLGYEICNHFGHFKRRSQLGIDFAVDRSGRIFLIEVNHEIPSHPLFLRLKDKSFYRNIKRLARAYKMRKKR